MGRPVTLSRPRHGDEPADGQLVVTAEVLDVGVVGVVGVVGGAGVGVVGVGVGVVGVGVLVELEVEVVGPVGVLGRDVGVEVAGNRLV